MFVKPSDKKLYYSGRIDDRAADEPKFFYAGSFVRMNFKGEGVTAKIRNHRFYNDMELGIICDGKESKVSFGQQQGEIVLELAQGLDPKTEHFIILFKRQDATHYYEFLGFEISGNAELLEPPARPSRRIEVYGDSVSAGAVCEAFGYEGKCDPEDAQGIFDNAWHSYASITARNLGAQLHNNAQGGIALFDKTGYYHYPDHIGVESTYDKLCYFPEGGITQWDFSRFDPHIVIFAFGQNDCHHEGHEDFDIHDASYRAKWKKRYKEVLLDIKSRYTDPTFILMTTVLCHDIGWDEAIEEIKCELISDGLVSADKIYHHIFVRNGRATPGHPRIAEQQEMAEELTAFISSLGDKVWGK